MATGRVRPNPPPDGWVPPDEGSPGLFTYGTDVEADADQDVSGVWWYQPPAPGTVADVTVGLYVQATQLLLPGATATIPSGSIVAGEWNLGLFTAPVTMTGGVTYTIVATTSGESASQDPVGYPIDDPTNTVHLPGPGRFQSGSGPYPAAGTWTGQHGVDIEMVEGEPANGTLDLVIPVSQLSLDAEAVASGSLVLSLPVVDLELEAGAEVTGSLELVLPVPDVSFTASTPSGDTVLPCSWDIPDPLCCDSWETLSGAQQAAAKDYAALVLWGATGRQFGLCEVTVRPCGMKRCPDGGADFYGYSWSSGTWVPYIFNGVWYNCGCGGACSCDPRCQIRLLGPVDSIVEITIGGVVVDPDTYRVDDQHWLVRTNGECWPTCTDMDTDDGDNVLVVTYRRGTPIPTALLMAGSILACEWGKACTGADCRLSGRVSSLARNGVQIDMVDPSQLLSDGFTGLPEVDAIIRAINPYRVQQRLRIYAPELRVPRGVTSA